MNKFIGNWKLETNNKFDDFLKYYQYSWIKRKLALSSNITLSIEKIDDITYKRIINIFTFLNSEEIYILDGQFHETPSKLLKSHSIKNDKLISKIIDKNIHWSEKSEIIKNKLHIKRTWIENTKEKKHLSKFLSKIN